MMMGCMYFARSISLLEGGGDVPMPIISLLCCTDDAWESWCLVHG